MVAEELALPAGFLELLAAMVGHVVGAAEAAVVPAQVRQVELVATEDAAKSVYILVSYGVPRKIRSDEHPYGMVQSIHEPVELVSWRSR